MPALPLDEAGKYVAAAYLVFLALILIYVAIMAAKISRMERQIDELVDLTEGEKAGRSTAPAAVITQDAGLEAPRRKAGQSPAAQARPEVDRPPQDAGLEAPRR